MTILKEPSSPYRDILLTVGKPMDCHSIIIVKVNFIGDLLLLNEYWHANRLD
jgi:hypothetical protein